jgi:hypothetical protein
MAWLASARRRPHPHWPNFSKPISSRALKRSTRPSLKRLSTGSRSEGVKSRSTTPPPPGRTVPQTVHFGTHRWSVSNCEESAGYRSPHGDLFGTSWSMQWDESSRVTAACLYRASTAARVRSSHSTEHSRRMSISLIQVGLKRAR